LLREKNKMNLSEYWYKKYAEDAKKPITHWEPTDKPKYVIGVKYQIEEIDDKEKQKEKNQQEGIF
jgi:hypothetical protein